MLCHSARSAACAAGAAVALAVLCAPAHASQHIDRLSDYDFTFNDLTFAGAVASYNVDWNIRGDFVGDSRNENFELRSRWTNWRTRQTGGVTLNAPFPNNNQSAMVISFNNPNNLTGSYGVGYDTPFSNTNDGSSWIVRRTDGVFWYLDFAGGGFGLDAPATFNIRAEVPGRWLLNYNGVGGVSYTIQQDFVVTTEWVYDRQRGSTLFEATLPNSQGRVPDLRFTLIGIPAPSAGAVLVLAGVAAARRRR